MEYFYTTLNHWYGFQEGIIYALAIDVSLWLVAIFCTVLRNHEH